MSTSLQDRMCARSASSAHAGYVTAAVSLTLATSQQDPALEVGLRHVQPSQAGLRGREEPVAALLHVLDLLHHRDARVAHGAAARHPSAAHAEAAIGA